MAKSNYQYVDYFPYYSVTLLVIGVIYLGWGPLNNHFFPHYYDPHIIRFLISAYLTFAAIVTKRTKYFSQKKTMLLNIFFFLVAIHMGFLGCVNDDASLYHTSLILGAVLVGVLSFSYKLVIAWTGLSLSFASYSLYHSFSEEKVIIIVYILTACFSSMLIAFNRATLVKALAQKNEELEEQKAIAIHSSKLTAVGEIAAGVAHEINNPLTIINGNIDRIKKACERGDGVDTIIHSANRAKNAVKRSKTIIDALRSFSRDTSSDGVNGFSINKIAKDSLELVQNRLILEDIDLRICLCEIEPKVNVNEFEISQIIVNLLNNSFYAIKDMENKWIELSTYTDESSTYLRVTDSGHGIKKDVAQKLMSPFFTTKPSGIGTGLGLSISQNIATKYKGSLNYVASEKHTTFQLSLPNYDSE